MLRRSKRIAFWRGEREKPGPFTRGAPAPMGDVMSPLCSPPWRRGDMATGDPESRSHWDPIHTAGLLKPLCRRGCAPPHSSPLLISIDLLLKSMLAVPSPPLAGRGDGAV